MGARVLINETGYKTIQRKSRECCQAQEAVPGIFSCSIGRFCGYRLEQRCLDASCSAQPPEDTRQSKYQFPLHCGFGIITGNHRGFEGLVIFCIFEHINDSLGGEAVTHGIAPRTRLALQCRWPGAFECVAPIGFNLLERTPRTSSHGHSGEELIKPKHAAPISKRECNCNARPHGASWVYALSLQGEQPG
jgi:hypothetical protein